MKKQNIEEIRLHYDRASKMANFGNATIGPLIASTIALYNRSSVWFRIFVAWTILAMIRLLIWNREMNIYFDRLLKEAQKNNK